MRASNQMPGNKLPSEEAEIKYDSTFCFLNSLSHSFMFPSPFVNPHYFPEAYCVVVNFMNS